jgi:formate dehydrogenase major subunit
MPPRVGLRDVRYGYGGANHLGAADETNPISFRASKCIVCSRCVRACEEVQGTFALTMRGAGSRHRSARGRRGHIPVERMRLLRRLCSGLPHGGADEKAVKEIGKPERAVVTTCAYCGVGCTFRAEMRGQQLVRMVPWKDGKANRGHSCVKGRFAWGYANHADRITRPMIREASSSPGAKGWEEAMASPPGV